jgi:hypothetical protein
MADRFTCKRCGRVVSSARYGGKRSTEYWSLKKFGLCPACLRGPRPSSYLVGPHKIRRFYRRRFTEAVHHTRWPRLWSKHFRARLDDGHFFKLNRYRPRLNFKSLRKYCVKLAPVNVYMSVLNWLMPQKVGEKGKANRAYPIGGEYVVDVDIHLFYQPHPHYVGLDGVCTRCLSISRDATVTILDKLRENHRDIHVVFSGRKGFHVHVWDFDVTDWTRYDAGDPVKSHEVARLIYTRHIKGATGGFDDAHFKLAVDPMRVITFPGSLNGRSGLVCSYLGGPAEFERSSIDDIVSESRTQRFLYDDEYESLIHAHPEPLLRIRR